MNTNFDREILFDNITYLIKVREMKMGEFEKTVGVCKGYVARTKADQSVKPGIEFVCNAASELGVSVDTLINVKLNDVTPSEMYYISFMEKLILDTSSGKLEWDDEAIDGLKMFGVPSEEEAVHPLLFERDGELVFMSASFGKNTLFNDKCYELSLKNAEIYLMSVKNADGSRKALELWMVDCYGEKTLISTDIRDWKLKLILYRLYETVGRYMQGPTVKEKVRFVIDAFMNDDLESKDKFGSF